MKARTGATLIAIATALISAIAGRIALASVIPNQLFLVLFLAVVAAASTVAAMAPNRAVTWGAPGLFWLALLGLGVVDFARSTSLTSAVEPVEALVILLTMVTVAWAARPSAIDTFAIAAAASMLFLFGIIHLLEAPSLAEIVPSWLPASGYIPYLTGPILIAGGAGLVPVRSRRFAALAVAGLFLSWLPLVHLERLANDLTNAGEWRFALNALALSGALIIIASIGTRPNDSHHEHRR